MYFSSGFFGSLLTGSGKWSASLSAKGFEFSKGGERKQAIPYESICGLRSVPGVMWSEIAIESSKGSVRFDGIGNTDANLLMFHLQSKVADSLLKMIEPHRQPIANLSRSFKMLLGREQATPQQRSSWNLVREPLANPISGIMWPATSPRSLTG